MTPEHGRLEESRTQGAPWRKWGPYLSRAAVGDGPRGLQRVGRRLGLLQPRPGPLARVSLGRGRAGGDLRRPAAALLRAGPVERPGPDPQGAAVRPDQQRGQSRRGRQGVLLLPRLHADPLVHEVPLQVPAGGLSVRRPRRDQPAAGAARSSSTSCSTPACSTRIATSTCSSSTPRRRRRTSSSRSPSTTVVRSRPTLHVLPTLWFRNTWSWGGEGAATGAPAARPRGVIAATHPELGQRFLSCDGAAALLFTENETNTERLFGAPNRTPYVKDGIDGYIVHGRRDAVNPGQKGTKASAHYPLTVGAGASRTIRLRLQDAAPADPVRRPSTRRCRRDGRRRTSSTPRSSRRH